MNNEIWCDIEGYEGLYKVSDKGRVKSLGNNKSRKEKILKFERDKKGYLAVQLCKNGEIKRCFVHRLVAQTFIPNPDNLPQVNHKDENPSNNNIENLEWCDQKYNNNYGTHIQRIVEKRSKSVIQYTLDGKFVKEWKSQSDVERNLGYSQRNISACCRGKYKSLYGYVWKYK